LPDIVDQQTRSRMMSGIRGKNTRPELVIRSGLHARGFRFRLHKASIPGKPDLVLPRFRAVVFVNGCFWHHHTCHLFRMPSTRREFWEAKIARNVLRDIEVRRSLLEQGWRFITVWECAIKGRGRLDINEVITRIAEWLRGTEEVSEIAGMQ
jgi:DNA mismatch endonuclease, patch repair protein